MNNKRKILIMLDWSVGPIVGPWLDENGRETTGISIIDTDPETQRLADQIAALYSPLYIEVESTQDNPPGLEYDYAKEKEVAPEILSLTKRLIARLEEINDGSYEIDDRITPQFEKVINSN